MTQQQYQADDYFKQGQFREAIATFKKQLELELPSLVILPLLGFIFGQNH